jgi:hypothetical protein
VGPTEIGKGTVIAIIESGVQFDYPDIMENIWLNPGELPGVDTNADGIIGWSEFIQKMTDTNHDGKVNLWDLFGSSFENGIDNDANGFVDDFLGWNFVAGKNDWPANNPYSNLSLLPPEERLNPPIDHGTFTSGFASAVTNNGIQSAGLGWNAKILPLQVAESTTDGNSMKSPAIAQAIRYAADHADIISMSIRQELNDDRNFTESLLLQDVLVPVPVVVLRGDLHDRRPARAIPEAGMGRDRLNELFRELSNRNVVGGISDVEDLPVGGAIRVLEDLHERVDPVGDVCEGAPLGAPVHEFDRLAVEDIV